MSACEDCGFAWQDLPTHAYAAGLAALDERFRERLVRTPEPVLSRRPAPEVWSPLEYACHVRDVLLAQHERIYLALVEDRPSFARMYREERVELARYADQAPGVLADQLSLAFALVGVALTGRTPEQWQRPLIYNYPGPQEHDLAWLGRHTLHECEHHLVDIDRGLATSS